MKPPNHGMRVRVSSDEHHYYWGFLVLRPERTGGPWGDDSRAGIVGTKRLSVWITDRVELLP